MTFIPFHDITNISPNRSWRVEVHGQHVEDFFRDRSGFVYRLIDNVSEKEAWSWKPTDDHRLADYPHDVWVNNQGWVVARLRDWMHAGLLVLSPVGDLRMFHLLQSIGDGEPGLFDNEPACHMGGSSIGPLWETCSISLFHEFEGRPYWSLMTWWRRRIVIDLENGQFCDDGLESHGFWISTLEEEVVLQDLRLTAKALQSAKRDDENPWGPDITRAYSAAYQAGSLGVVTAIPWLRKMESCLIEGGSTSDSWLSIVELPFRLIAKMSLLRLGVEPQWASNLILSSTLRKELCEFPETPTERSPDLIQLGMSQRELLKKIGAPEFLRNSWDYSFVEGERAFTVRVHWYDKFNSAFRKQCKEIPFHDPRSRQAFTEYRQAIESEPPVVERVELIDIPPWCVHESELA